MYVPYSLKGGWTDALADRSASGHRHDRSVCARHSRADRAQEFLTPRTSSENIDVTGGHWHHTEFAMDQMLMMRPTYEAAQYSTPIPGLFLCGAGCHPAAISRAAGHNAAREILR